MDWISVLSICSTVLLGIVGFIINTNLQRKNNMVEIITKKRIARRDQLQELSAEILRLTDIDYLSIVVKTDTNNFILELARSCSTLRSLLEFEFKKDAEIVKSAYALKAGAIAYLVGSLDKNELIQLRCVFSELIDIYFTTEWQRIKIETIGTSKRNLKHYETWMSLYEKNTNHFNMNKNIHDDAFDITHLNKK